MDKSFFKKITESLKRYLSLFGSWLKEKCHRYQLIRWFIVACLSSFFSNKHLFDLRSQDSQCQGPRECLGETDDDL